MLSSVSEGGKNRRLRHAENSRRIRELQRKLYRKAKQELRKPLEENDRKAVFGGEALPKVNKLNVPFDEGELEIES